jgi:hypothetical protein
VNLQACLKRRFASAGYSRGLVLNGVPGMQAPRAPDSGRARCLNEPRHDTGSPSIWYENFQNSCGRPLDGFCQ